MSAAQPVTGNAKHQAAVAATADRILELRADIRSQLEDLVTISGRLEDLLDTKQSIGLGFQTPEMREARGRQDAEDRAIARGIRTHTDHSFITGLAILRGDTSRPTGPTPAPVTMPPVSVLAEITAGLQHHIRRLGKVGLLAALEAEQTEEEDTSLCSWPRRPLTQLARAGINENATASIPQLARRLQALIDGYAKRPGLEGILRDLDHLHDKATDVVDGPSKTSHPDPCPWCGLNTLVVLHRAPGRTEMFVRCEGRHPCTCTDEWCECHRNPAKNRHEWINSGRAKNPVNGKGRYSLTRLIAERKDQARMESAATAALARIQELHHPTHLQPWTAECVNPTAHEDEHWVDAENGAGRICIACDPIAEVCAHCIDLTTGDESTWPCATIRAIEPPTANPDEEN